jgi:hypothetical protein
VQNKKPEKWDAGQRLRGFGSSVVYQVFADHWQNFLAVYEERFQRVCGRLRAVVQDVVERFLDCGNPLNGLARVQCDQCGDDFFVPFSCKCRGFCASCQARFAADWGEWLADKLLEPVCHRHATFTIPKMLRPYFRYNRSLMNDLSRAAHRAVCSYVEFSLGKGHIPGMVVVRQWHGQASRFHPHLHCLIAEGAWSEDGKFTAILTWDKEKIRQLFEAEVFKFLRLAGLLSKERMALIKSWRHSGFNVQLERSLDPRERDEITRLGRYLLRAPVTLNRLDYDRCGQLVTVDTDDGQGQELDVLDLIARLVVQIPDKFERLQVYYGVYANASKLRNALLSPAGQAQHGGTGDAPEQHDFKDKKKTRLRWAQLLERIWNEDPFLCPNCAGRARIVAFITSPDNVQRILDHLNCHHADPPPPRYRAPPRLSTNPLG